MGHEGGGRGHLSLSDRVIISENSPVISPLLAKYPNDSRADIKCHANRLHNIVSAGRALVQGPGMAHLRALLRKLTFYSQLGTLLP